MEPHAWNDAPEELQRTRQRGVEDLERRIAELEELDESVFGSFNRWDWLVCVLGAVVLPAAAMWWFAG